MTKPDLIACWPRNCDYPLWRQFIRDERGRFNEIIIAFTETNAGFDYREFVKIAMYQDYIHTIDPQPLNGEDWRNVGVNAALLHSYNAEWIWFTEQDFYPRGEFWEDVEGLINRGFNVVAAYQGDRMHPCCIFIKREILNKTNKNFAVTPDKRDHFYTLQKDLEELKEPVGIIEPRNYYHYNGLSSNFYLLTIGKEPNYQKEQFVLWLTACLQVSVTLHPEFVRIANAGIKRLVTPPTTPPDHSPGGGKAENEAKI